LIPLHLPYYAPSARDSVKNFVLGLNEKNFYAEVEETLRKDFGFEQVYLTKSCTNALEVIALLLDLKLNDEVIVPSYTFVSSANAFALFGAKIVYADSQDHHPNVSVESILKCITDKTKAIVVMHYGGVAIDELEMLRTECDKRKIFLIEDAAHCMGAYLKDKHLGKFGHASTFSFHESKNITCIEGGLLVINHEPWLQEVDSIINKGTNRAQFDSKKAAFYEWVSLGSSFKMNSLHAAILVEQIKFVKKINDRRLEIFDFYLTELNSLKQKNHFYYSVPKPEHKHNAHNFWIELPDENTRTALQKYLASKEIFSTFHYLALHLSPFGKQFHNQTELPNSVKYEKTLLRLPLYYQQTLDEAKTVVEEIKVFFSK